jgi:hypothetical protein
MLFGLLGMFPTAVLFGLIGYLAQRLLAKALMLFVSDRLGTFGQGAIVITGGALMAGNVALVYLTARWVFVALGNVL